MYFEGIFLSTITPIFLVLGHKVLILFGNKFIELSPINIEYFSDLDEEGLEQLLLGITIFYIQPMTKLEEISFDSFDSESDDQLSDFNEFMEIHRDGAITPPLLDNKIVNNIGYSFV